MEQEYIPLPEEFSPPPENRPPEEYPAADPSADGIPPRAKMSRAKYLLVAGLLLTTTTLTAVTGGTGGSAVPPDTPIPVDRTDALNISELLDTSWQYENGAVVHFSDGVGWWEKDGRLLRFAWDKQPDGTAAYTCGYAEVTSAASSTVLRSVTASDTAWVQDDTLRMSEPFGGLAGAQPISGYTAPDAAAYLVRPTLSLLTDYDWAPADPSGPVYYTELHFDTDGTGSFGLGSGGSGTQSSYRFTWEAPELPYEARVRIWNDGDVVFSNGDGTTLTSRAPRFDCALLFTADGMQLAVIDLFSDGCTMLLPTAK